MQGFPKALQGLIRELTRLPSIGEKSASRLAYHLVTAGAGDANRLSQAIVKALQEVALCAECFHLTDVPESENRAVCSICADTSREEALLCIVEKPMDVLAIERVGEYRGRYHVLHGVWAPLRGKGTEDLTIAPLLERIGRGKIKESILALAATVEGDATALYLAKILSERGCSTTRLAQGIPKGGELEYADDITLSRAFSGRQAMRV